LSDCAALRLIRPTLASKHYGTVMNMILRNVFRMLIVGILTIGWMSYASAASASARSSCDKKDECKQRKVDCIATCSDSALPTPPGNDGWNFYKCYNNCMGDCLGKV
jgi:hypothetical protein